MRSLDDVARDLERAEEALRRRARTGTIAFRSVRAALGWYYERRRTMQSPVGLFPRTARTYYGERVAQPIVDGGEGGDLDEVLATLVTISDALRDLAAYDARLHEVVRLRHGEGWPQARIAEHLGHGQATISAWLGAGEGFLAGLLIDAGVVR